MGERIVLKRIGNTIELLHIAMKALEKKKKKQGRLDQTNMLRHLEASNENEQELKFPFKLINREFIV